MSYYKYCFYVNEDNPLDFQRILSECGESDVLIVSANHTTAYMAVKKSFLKQANAINCELSLAGQPLKNWGASTAYYQEYEAQPRYLFRYLKVYRYQLATIPIGDVNQVCDEVKDIRARILLGHKVKVYQP